MMRKRNLSLVARLVFGAALFLVQSCHRHSPAPASVDLAAGLIDGNAGDDWTGYGRTYGEQHFSPLEDINSGNVAKLGLAWSFDLPAGNPMSGPIEVGGTLYTSTGYSVVRALDVRTGRLLWTFDPKAPEASGKKLRQGWGSRGLAYWNDKIFVGTQDGRLIALNARNGREVWTQLTVDKNDYRFISGAPRVFEGKVIIGHGGADAADTRGYVTTYDTETGKQLWRFYLVPGNPTKGFEDTAQAMAAKTWSGEWWKYGGGGTAWNSFTYDRDTDTILVGTGNGAPWNHKIRSQGKGDNLFLCSIVALDAKTGRYKWHYQFNPGEAWDYNASMDMQLADLIIDGHPRKVVMEAPKNGFFYVIDRTNGKLISADKIAYTTWADRIDLATGRPIENPAARFPTDKPFALFPNSMGAHTWLPSAFSPKSGLIYLPVAEMGANYSTKGYEPGWRRPPNNVLGFGYNLDFKVKRAAGGPSVDSFLLAWDPVRKREAWRVSTPGGWNGGILATGGNLVFQGEAAGNFVAYEAGSGKPLWTFDATVSILAPPITYRVGGRQYITIIAGIGTSAGLMGDAAPMSVDYRTQPRRILTFALGGTQRLPKTEAMKIEAMEDKSFRANPASAARGSGLFAKNCMICHGIAAIAGGTAPDLRRSAVPASDEAFRQVVREGVLVTAGMPRFEEIDDTDLGDIRQYLRSQADVLRRKRVKHSKNEE